MAAELEPAFSTLLRLLDGCPEAAHGPLRKQQRQGVTYKTLAAIGHRVGMNTPERTRWYRVVESAPLTTSATPAGSWSY